MCCASGNFIDEDVARFRRVLIVFHESFERPAGSPGLTRLCVSAAKQILHGRCLSGTAVDLMNFASADHEMIDCNRKIGECFLRLRDRICYEIEILYCKDVALIVL